MIWLRKIVILHHKQQQNKLCCWCCCCILWWLLNGTTILTKVFKWAILGLILQFLQQYLYLMWKMAIQYLVLGFEPKTSWTWVSSIQPRLPPKCCLLNLNTKQNFGRVYKTKMKTREQLQSHTLLAYRVGHCLKSNITENGFKQSKDDLLAVVMAQLGEPSLPTPEVCSSNLVIKLCILFRASIIFSVLSHFRQKTSFSIA